MSVHTSQGAQDANIVKTEPLKLELQDFLKSITEGREPVVGGKEGLEVLKIALEASSNPDISQLILHR